MMMKHIYPLFLLFVAFTPVLAQRPDSLSNNPYALVEGLQPYLTASKDKDIEEDFEVFAALAEGGGFTEAEFNRIHKLANRMLEERMSSNPYFINYLRGLTAIRKVPETERLFVEWHNVLDTLLSSTEDRPARDFSTFLSFSISFFDQNTLRSSGTTWQYQGEGYSFAYREGEPQLVFGAGDLIGSRKEDTLRIQETEGIYLPLDLRWIGEKGKITWERAGLGADVFASFDTFSIDLRKSLFDIQNAKLAYPAFFGNERIPGSFSDKVMVSSDSRSYPRFRSDNRNLTIDNFAEDISYVGGFSLEGNTIYGYGQGNQKAQIQIFNQEGELAFKGRSERFIIRKEELIVGQQVDMAFYFGQDSIYHPSVNIRYEVPDKKLELTRGERGSDQSPFYSSLHRVTLDADDLTAFIERDSVEVGRTKPNMVKKAPLKIQSFQYFDRGEYQSYQGLSAANPVALLKRAAEEFGMVIDADMLAKKMNARYTVENIISLLYRLAADGFIIYDGEEEKVYVKEKTMHFANAVDERVDYDNLDLTSSTQNVNAVINLENEGIYVSGIQDFELSPRQKVAILPSDTTQVVLLPDRNLDFGGTVMAGYSQLDGTGFHFDYNKFMLQLDSVDRWQLFVPQERPISNPQTDAFSLNSTIESFSGQLVIDAETNKSGRQNIPIFPFLRTDSPAFVYYDTDRVKDTTYIRDSFYFKLEPFTFNRLDDYVREDVAFKGELISASIFPTFSEPLLIRDDYSLGFEHESPEEGYPIFGGKGQYQGTIDLSNRGLRGVGSLQYLGAQIEAEDFVFRPRQMEASALAFDLAEDRQSDLEVPQVHGDTVQINWLPYRDSMIIRSIEATPFALFQSGEHQLDGTLVLTPEGVQGEGVLDWPMAKMESGQFSFGAFSAQADTTTIRIKALEEQDAVAIQTENIQGRVDFDEEKGYFKANEAFLTTDLPYNQYRTSMNEFIWDMSGQNVSFRADTSKLGMFTSIHPDQDSLRFQGKRAFYDLSNYKLVIDEVPNIISADAFIYPDSGRVEIEAEGIMKQLDNAVILVDTLSRQHRIKRATVNIRGRKDYTASGFYEYNIGDKEQEIEFSNIVGSRIGKGSYSEKRTATRAQGEVTEADSFLIDQKTSFYGTISLASEDINLDFDGYGRLEVPKLPNRYWFRVRSKADKNNLAIKFDEPKTYDGTPLSTGLFLSREMAIMYPSVMMPLYFRKDRPVFPVSGVFVYDKKEDQFHFGDSTKVLHNDYRGNVLTLDNKSGRVTAEGTFNLGEGLQFVGIDAVGTATTQFQDVPDSLLAQTPPAPVDGQFTAGVTFPIPDKLLKAVENEIQASSFGGNAIPYLTDIDRYKKDFTMLFPPTKELTEALQLLGGGVFTLTQKNNPYTFLFTGLEMTWDKDFQSFVTTTPKAGLVSMSGQPLNKQLEIFMEIKMPTNGDDRLYFYIKLPNSIYYYFGYKQGILEINSNDNRFMDIATDLKKGDLIQKMGNGETFEIQVQEAGRATMFLRRVQAAGR